MTWLREYIKSWAVLIDGYLLAFMFMLMCIGLVLASVFLWAGLITGDNWVAVCGILFGTTGLGGSVSQFAKSRGSQVPPESSGYERPIVNDRTPGA